MRRISLNDCGIADIGKDYMVEIEDLTPTDRIIRDERGNDEKVLLATSWLEIGVSLLTAIN